LVRSSGLFSPLALARPLQDDLGPPLMLIRQHSKEHQDQIKLIRQSSKDWVEKHSKCALTDIVVDSHTGYILVRPSPLSSSSSTLSFFHYCRIAPSAFFCLPLF